MSKKMSKGVCMSDVPFNWAVVLFLGSGFDIRPAVVAEHQWPMTCRADGKAQAHAKVFPKPVPWIRLWKHVARVSPYYHVIWCKPKKLEMLILNVKQKQLWETNTPKIWSFIFDHKTWEAEQQLKRQLTCWKYRSHPCVEVLNPFPSLGTTASEFLPHHINSKCITFTGKGTLQNRSHQKSWESFPPGQLRSPGFC